MAAPVNSQRAAAAVSNWLKADHRPFGEPLGASVQRVETFKDQAGEALYHVVYLAPSGFVIMAGDDLVEPIIGFAAAGHFDPSSDNPLGALVNKDIPARVAHARQSGAAAPPNSAASRAKGKWQQLQQPQPVGGGGGSPSKDGLSLLSDIRVAPFVQSTWGQQTAAGTGTPALYNYYTPPGPAGNAANYPAGCVATAMAQLMRYYQYPTLGVGTASFQITVNGVSMNQSLRGGDGAGGPYNWSDMPLVPSANPTVAQCQAIGALVADSATTVHMDYAASGSSSVLFDTKDALVSTFYYGNAIKGFNDNNELGAGLIGMINPNLDARYPVMLGIRNSVTSSGHAVVVDGYGYTGATLYHHLNLGWSGMATAWYQLPNIDAGLSLYDVVDGCVYNVYTNGSGEIISGRVLDQISRPVANATVTATRTGGLVYTATTDTNGIYALARIPASSSYSITVSKPNYTSTTGNFSTGASSDWNAASGNRWGADFTLNMLPTVADHFVWSAIGSTQAVNTPVPVTITAKNVTNGPATGFNGIVALSGAVTGNLSTNNIVGNLSSPQTDSDPSYPWTDGYAFTPNVNLQVTHVRSYYGSRVSIWTDSGTILAAQDVSSVPGTWVETPLSTPLTLSAGTTYRVCIYCAPGTIRYFTQYYGQWPTTFANGTVGQNLYYISADGFPSYIAGTGMGPFIDLRYTVGFSNSIPISPTSSGAFVNGAWSGSITVSQVVTNLVLRADDGAGHTGSTLPFTVIDPNAGPPNIVTQPRSQTNNAGDNVTFSLAATGSPAPKYFWRRNGLPISGANASSYTLNNVQLPDSGSQFSCVVSNSWGAVTSQTATLTVICTNVLVAAQPRISVISTGGVYAVATLPDGAMIVGGNFTNINGITRNCIARLLPDGSLDMNFNPNPDDSVLTLAVSGTNVYAGGYFTSIGGLSRGGLAKLDSSTGAVDPNWNPSTGPEGWAYVRTIAISEPNVYVGGYFTTIGGVSRYSVARVNSGGTGLVDANWDPSATYRYAGSRYLGNVNTIVLGGTDVYVGGYFDTIGTLARTNIARLSSSGTGAANSIWNPNAGDEVFALAVNGTGVYAGGVFTSMTGLGRNYIAKLATNSTGAADPAWNPGADGYVRALAVNGLFVYAGGTFANIGGLPRNYLAKLNSAGTGAADATWDANPDDEVDALALSSTGLYVTGWFSQMGGQPRGGIALLTFAPLRLGPALSSSGQFQSTLTGERGQGFEILASTNLVDWAPICTLTNSTGTTPFTDPAASLPSRFYRAHQLP